MRAKHSRTAATAIFAFCVPLTWAQEQRANLQRPAESDKIQLEEIIVTAQKRSEDVQQVPIAISVLDGEELKRQHIFDASQLQYSIASLQQQSVNNQVGATNFSIRGVGTSIYGPGVESSVATVLDDVALARPAMGVVQFFDIDRVEVLRGPQGMLFGKNASAGLINIVTEKPHLGEFGGLSHLSYGRAHSASNGNEALAQAAVNIPVGSTSALRVSGFATRQDGFGTNVYMHEDLGLTEYGARVKYLWTPLENLEIYLSGDYAKERGPAGSVLYRRADAPGGFMAAQDTAVGITAGPANTRIASDARTANHFEVGGAHGRVTYTFDNGYSLTDVIAWRKYDDRSKLDTDQLPIDFFNVNDQGRDQHQFSNELRFASPTAHRFEYQVGLYYLELSDTGLLHQEANLQPVFPPAPPGYLALFGGSSSAHDATRSYAAFGQSKLSLTSSLRLIAGGRFTRDEVYGEAASDGRGYFIPAGPTGNLTGSLNKNNFSFRVGAEYDIASRVMGYLTYAQGYKSPTFGGGPTGTGPIKAEIPTNVELGLKSSLLDNRLVFDLALYHVEYKDFQAQAFNPELLRFATTNAGKVETKGLELDVRARPAQGLTFMAALAFNDGTYKEYDSVGCYYGQPTGTSGRNVCLPNGTTDVTGNQLAFAPKASGSAQAEYERRIGNSLTGFVTTNYYYRSSVNFTAAHDPMTHVGGYGIFGGSFGIETASGTRLAVFARNLFDKRIPTFIVADIAAPFDGDAAKGGDYWQQFGETSFRTVGMSLDMRF
jgi:iron complex outermembrane recepter protein